MLEHFFQCPHCWQEISMMLDTSISQQLYIEDCEVCCNPIELKLTFQDAVLQEFEVSGIQQ